jgi:hypothetical protein
MYAANSMLNSTLLQLTVRLKHVNIESVGGAFCTFASTATTSDSSSSNGPI